MMRTIRERVASGEYCSTNEAVRDAIRLWQIQWREDTERLASIRTRIHQSLDDPRPNLSSDEVAEHLKALFASAAQEGVDDAP